MMKNKCGKESFVDKESADKVLAIYNEKYKNKKDFALLTNSYKCNHCGTWHLTSQTNYQTKLKKVEIELLETKNKLISREKELFKRIDDSKALLNKKSNSEISALKRELEKSNFKLNDFKRKFEAKAKEHNNLINFILKYNKNNKLEELENLVKEKFLK